MDRIEERLRRLLGWQHQIVRMETGIMPDAELASSYKYRDAHQDAIAADWGAMVEALEAALKWIRDDVWNWTEEMWQNLDQCGVDEPYAIIALQLKAILARVKEESS